MIDPSWDPKTSISAKAQAALLAISIEQLTPNQRTVLTALNAAGGRALVVGGSVRDALLNIPPKDVDIEVYNLGRDAITKALKKVGRVDLVGKSFGVIKVSVAKGDTIDVSVPRRENKTGRGIKGFVMEFPTDMTPAEAASRRDYTINAMAYDPVTRELFDFYNGIENLEQKVLRHVSDAFAEDPERVRRGMQFAARFDLAVAPETAELCRRLLAEADTSAPSRIWGEWEKWAAKGKYPIRGLEFLRTTGWTATAPEIEALIDCPQDLQWHPEGDVFVHTAFTCERAAEIAERDSLNKFDRTVLLLSALCHDFGKPSTTIHSSDGRIRSPEHAYKGVPIAEAFLNSINAPNDVRKQVLPLVKEHMTHMFWKGRTKRNMRSAVQSLAELLHPATIRQWERLVEADSSARPPLPRQRPAKDWLRVAEEIGCADGKVAPVLLGRDLIELGVKPGPEMGQLLQRIRTAQLKDRFRTKEDAIRWLWRNTSALHLVRGEDLIALGYPEGKEMGQVLKEILDLQIVGKITTRDAAIEFAQKKLR